MEKLELLNEALEYIEEHLKDTLKTEEIATHCACSKASLEKLFRYLQHISVHDYVTRRRMTLAAKELQQNPDVRILDLAMNYGFSSNESFSRTFYQIWNCMPSEFRKSGIQTELFPKYVGYKNIGEGGFHMSKKNVDISELYDLFKERKNCYFVCADIHHLMAINDIDSKAGDLAILEALRRMNAVAGEDDYVFRIGADEFVILTHSNEKSYAMEKLEQILSHNGETISFAGQDIPVVLYGATYLYQDKVLRYGDLFTQLQTTIRESERE